MYALRSWLRTPRLAVTLLACIAVSIGGTATVLTFVHAILIRPLPYPEAARLVSVAPDNLGDTDRSSLIGSLEARLNEMNAYDPISTGANALLLAAVALLACWLPALRAARTDPMTALRAE